MPSPQLSPLWLACGLLTVPTLGQAAPPVHVSAAADLDLPDQDNLKFEEAIEEAARKGASDAKIEIQEDATASVNVEVSWSNESRADYIVKVDVRDGTNVLANQSLACDACGIGEVLERVRSKTATILIDAHWPPSHTEQAAAETMTPTSSSERIPAVSDNRSSGLTALGWGGIGVGAVGIAAMISGAAFWARGDKTTIDPDSSGSEIRGTTIPYRGIGIGMVVGGVAAAAIGGGLLSVDIRKIRRNPIALSPALGLKFTGVSLTGRF